MEISVLFLRYTDIALSNALHVQNTHFCDTPSLQLLPLPALALRFMCP